MTAPVDILIPTYGRPAALAVTLTSLCAQSFRGFRVLVSDQTETIPSFEAGEVKAGLRLLSSHGHELDVFRHLPRLGMAEQRQFLLKKARAPYVLFLDDDLILEAPVVERMFLTLTEEGCGFVGCAPIGLSYLHDVRPDEQDIQFWDGPVMPEAVRPHEDGWERHRIHNAANVYHLEKKFRLSWLDRRRYRVAWVGGCVMYERQKLLDVGAFGFWHDLPPNHAGEEIVVQLRLMSRFGGCGLLPSGVYHQELPTTVVDRTYDAPLFIEI